MYDKFDKTSGVSKKNEDAETLLQYNKKYLEILNLFGKDIQYIEEELKKLRAEQLDFYENQVPKIRKKLNEEEVDAQIIDDWIAKLEKNIEINFKMSTNLLNDFIVEKQDEFSREIRKRIGVKIETKNM